MHTSHRVALVHSIHNNVLCLYHIDLRCDGEIPCRLLHLPVSRGLVLLKGNGLVPASSQIRNLRPCAMAIAHTRSRLMRGMQADPAMVPTPLNVHRLLITGVLLAAKLMDDNYFNNAYYAKVSALRSAC